MEEVERPGPTGDSDETTDRDQAAASDTPGEYVDDSQLPEDLRPSEDNPLARNPDVDGDDAAVASKQTPHDEPDVSPPAQ